MAKQTGPWNGVKGAVCAALLLTGCADDHWYKSDKTPAETSADYKACNDKVEEAALTRAGQQRASYNPARGALPPNTLQTGEPGANLGETPMQLHDRVVAEKSFDNDLRDCMIDKGYSLGKSGP